MVRQHTAYRRVHAPPVDLKYRKHKKAALSDRALRSPLTPRSGHLNRSLYYPDSPDKTAAKYSASLWRQKDARGSRWDLRQDQDDDEHDDILEDADTDDDEEIEALLEDERTLVSLFQHDSPQKDERYDLIALAEAFKVPMTAHGQKLAEHAVHALVPAAKRVKHAHDVVQARFDRPFAEAVAGCDDACRQMEALALQTGEELRQTYEDTQRKVNGLFKELEAAYACREELWDTFLADFTKTVECAEEDLNELPEDIEQTIAILQKKSKELEKNKGDSAQAKEKMLQSLLKNL